MFRKITGTSYVVTPMLQCNSEGLAIFYDQKYSTLREARLLPPADDDVLADICQFNITSRLRAATANRQYCARTSFFHSGTHSGSVARRRAF